MIEEHVNGGVRLAIVENGVVVNVIIGEPGFAGGIECDDAVNIGWAYAGGQFSAPQPVGEGQ